MEKIIGDLIYDSDVDYSDVEEITGYIDCRGVDTRESFPNLTTIGGYIDCSGADTRVLFPNLTTVGGCIECSGADTRVLFPNLKTVGGNIYCRGADTRVLFPNLTTVGGYIECRGADTRVLFPKLIKTECGDFLSKQKIYSAFRRKDFLFYDGILSRVIDTKVLKSGVKVYRLEVVGKTSISYCIESDGVYSHGETIKEARESLLYKIGERDKSEYEGWTLDKRITKRQAIESYRVITGACEYGVCCFVEGQGKLKLKYSVREVIDLTKGQYGNMEYSAFFSKKR